MASGRCGFCGSAETFVVPPQGFREWILLRSGALLLRCHDCGRRQSLRELPPLSRPNWYAGGALMKLVIWAGVVLATAGIVFALIRGSEQGLQGPEPARGRTPRARPSAPAPSPSPGPFVLRSTPSSGA